MIKKTLWGTLFLLLGYNLTFAQKNVVSVNPLTGTVNVVIPITSISSGSINVPVNLVYVATGVKVKDTESGAGMGWQVSAQGQISREVRGLPDDCEKDDAGNTLLGWLYNTSSTKINSFTIANVNNSSCTDEATDVTYINSNFSNYFDTEPDIYYVDAPGLSFQFAFDGIHTIQPLSNQDVKITYSTNSTTGAIEAFTVVNNKGVKYEFTVFDAAGRKTYGTEANIKYLKNEYEQYKNGVHWNATWYLTKITDPNFNAINFTYTPGVFGASRDSVNFYITDPATNVTALTPQYTILESHILQQLTTIANNIDQVNFSYLSNSYTSATFVNEITGMGKTIHFDYNSIKCNNSYYTRFFLKGISMIDPSVCVPPVSYQFSYAGQRLVSNPSPNYYVGYQTDLPDSTSIQVDYWGYYNHQTGNSSLLPSVSVNPSNTSYQRYLINADNLSRTDYSVNLAGSNNRIANPQYVMSGTLNQITYNDNASTSIAYESNDYYDPSAGAVVKGGGIRVRQITDYDGIDINRNIVRNYTYLDPSTGSSSGKPVTLPMYAFTQPYGGSGTTFNLWNYSTVRSENDLSNEDHTIMYSFVTQSQPGAGSTLYEYYTPATNWDLSASPDWAPTLDYSGRLGCVAVGFLKNNTYSYPFAPNPNYSFERGLPKKVTNYDGSGNEVAEKSYTYARTNSPTVITAFKWDNNAFAMGYAKYSILTNTSKLISVLDEKVFDSQAQNHSQETITNYTYGSAYHKLLTAQAATNSNGVTQTVNYKYVKDYVITTASDPNVVALHQLQQQNINIPVETYTQVGSKYTNGQLVKFDTFNFTLPDASTRTLYLPSQKLQFVVPDGTTSFTPSAISSGLFTNDSKYYVAENDLLYDNNGFIQTLNDNNKHVSTVLIDPYVQMPIAKVSNAAANEIGLDNFDNPHLITAFAPTDGVYSYNYTPRAGYLAFDMAVGKVLTKTVTKNATAKNYIFSVWIKTNGNSGNLSLTLGSSSPVSLAFTNTGSNWQYFEYKVPVTSLGSTFSVSFQSSAAIVVDDVCFYPENAEISSTEYDYVFHNKFYDTNTNGVSAYYTYDVFGRPSLVCDQDWNIVQRKSYIPKSQYYDNTVFTPAFTYFPIKNNATYNPVAFDSNNTLSACQFPGLTYTWDFGDGSSTVTGTTASHFFPSTGSYTVKLTLTASNISSQTSSQKVNLIATPVNVVTSSDAVSGTGDFQTIKFYKGGVLKYTFSNQPGSGNIPFNSAYANIDRDTYDITVQVFGTQYGGGGNGYASLAMTVNGTTTICKNFVRSGLYSYSGVDLTATDNVSFNIAITTCP